MNSANKLESHRKISFPETQSKMKYQICFQSFSKFDIRIIMSKKPGWLLPDVDFNGLLKTNKFPNLQIGDHEFW